MVSCHDGFWLICFLFRSKYRIIVGEYFDSQLCLVFVGWFRFTRLFRLGSLCLRFWVMVRFSVGGNTLGKCISEDKALFNFWANNFSTGEVPCWLGCEFRDNMTRKLSSELRFALLRVCLAVWMDLFFKSFDC